MMDFDALKDFLMGLGSFLFHVIHVRASHRIHLQDKFKT